MKYSSVQINAWAHFREHIPAVWPSVGQRPAKQLYTGQLCSLERCGGITLGTERCHRYGQAVSLCCWVSPAGLHCCAFVALVTWGSRIRPGPRVLSLQWHYLCFLYTFFAGQFIVRAGRKTSHQFNSTTSPWLPSFTASPHTHTFIIQFFIFPLPTHSNLKLSLKLGQSNFLFLLSVSSYYIREGGFSFCWAKSKLGSYWCELSSSLCVSN